MRSVTPALVFPALLLAMSPCFAGDEARLEWKFEKDQTFLYKITQRSEVTFDIPTKGPSTTLVQLDLTPEFEVSAVKAGPVSTASIKGVYDAVAFQLEVPNMGGLQFDSTSDAERQAAKVDKFKAAMLGLASPKTFKFTCSMASNGGITKMSGHNRYVPRAFTPQAFKDSVPIAACVLCQQILSDKAVEETMSDVFPPLPKDAALPGDKWKGESSGIVYPLGQFVFSSEYVLKEVREGKIAVITCTSEVRKDASVEPGFGLPPKDDPTYGMLKDALKKMNIKESKREGEFEFDLEKKEIVKGKITLEMQVGASINAFGQNYDLNFKVTMTRTVEKAEKQK